jgi:hypothetical protein
MSNRELNQYVDWDLAELGYVVAEDQPTETWSVGEGAAT